MSRIGIITNPHSKLNKRNPTIIRQLDLACRGRAEFVKTNSLRHLKATIGEFYEKGIDVIGICGGDGSISRAINAIIKIYPPDQLPKVAILRGGTMNLIAAELGIGGKPISILNRLLAKDHHQTSSLPTLKVNDKLGFVYADGSNLLILEQFYLNKSGIFGAFLLGIRIVISFLIGGSLFDRLFKESHFSIAEIKKPISSSLGNFAGTIGKLPLGIPILPLTKKYPGCFQFTLVTCPKKKLLWFLPFLMLKHNEGNSLGKYTICSPSLEVTFKGKTRFTLDGEIFSAPQGKVSFAIGPSIEFVKM